VDDTYPPLNEKIGDSELFKVVCVAPQVKFLPRLPGFNEEHLPGCAVEALVTSSSQDDLSDMQAFYNQAEELGLHSIVVYGKK